MPPVGRPAQEQKTDQTRAWAEQVEKLQWLYRIEGTRSADFIGPLIAEPLDEAFERIRPIVEQIKLRDEQARKLRDEPPVLANDLGEAGA